MTAYGVNASLTISLDRENGCRLPVAGCKLQGKGRPATKRRFLGVDNRPPHIICACTGSEMGKEYLITLHVDGVGSCRAELLSHRA
jgi:hypothetical protein